MAHNINYITKRIIELYYISDDRPLDKLETAELVSLFLELADHLGIEVPVER